MFRSLCVLSLIAFSACAVNADMTEMVTSYMEQVKGKLEQCGRSINPMEMMTNPDKLPEVGKSLFLCFAEAVGLVTETGALNVNILDNIPDSIPFKNAVATIVKDCANKSGGSPPENAFATFMCITHDQVMKTAVGKMVNKMQRFSKMIM